MRGTRYDEFLAFSEQFAYAADADVHAEPAVRREILAIVKQYYAHLEEDGYPAGFMDWVNEGLH